MPRFRPRSASALPSTGPLSLADVGGLIADAVRPGHFFVGRATQLEWDHAAAEEASWEVFRGRLLDPAHTRERRRFEAWNVYLIGDGARSPEPLLSVKLDAAAGEVHVVRAIHCYAWEGYDAGDNVILSRETKKWVRELVGTIHLTEFASADDLLDEVICQLFQAVVGTSRLPLTSVEAPLPAFIFGELAYFYRPDAAAEPMRSRRELVECGLYEGLSLREKAKWLETVLRSEPEKGVHLALNLFAARVGDDEDAARLLLRLLRSLFNEVSLSPFTGLTDNALLAARALKHHPLRQAACADFLGNLLRQIGRHLTAYDLVNFHHAGANYPDALLLDAVLREYLQLIELFEYFPDLFFDFPNDAPAAQRTKRLRRRALRQAWLIRQQYRGHAVPDAPTSPGENSRVLPDPYVRVPDEQILNPRRRTKKLFTDDLPGGVFGEHARAALRESVRDLGHPDELRELGLALYLDRPLGAFKAPGEPDQTPLLSYTAFSRSIAMQRLHRLGQDKTLLPDEELTSLRQALEALPVPGVPLAGVRSVPRPGVVSLADAAKAAEDFVFLRTTNSSLWDFFDLFDFAPLAERFRMPELTGEAWGAGPWLVLGEPGDAGGEIVLTFYEPGRLRKRLELSANLRDGYAVRAGVEYPRRGLRVRRVWQEVDGELRERDLSGEELFVRPM
jgi:hypothetical protein